MAQERFEFGNNIITEIVDELDKAKEYIRIVVFQIHNEEIIDKLVEKLKEGVSVEVITLPYESINDKVQKKVTKKLKELKKAGAVLNICDWNVGTTNQTKTVTQDWYCLHLKFIVTDKSAIALSANLISNDDIDAILINNNKEKIEEFVEKFELIKDTFINKKIKERIEAVVSMKEAKEILKPPKQVNTKNSVLHYPSSLCPDIKEIEEKIYIFPFDCKGRGFLEKIITEAESFVYISSERFVDDNFPFLLEKIKLRGVDVKILAKFKSQDYQERMNEFAKDLLSLDIDFKTRERVHAKMIITEKLIALGSVNLNKMNLGFSPKKGFWRANTETMIVSKNPDIIKKAKDKFLEIFNDSEDVFDKLILKKSNRFGDIIKKVFGIKHTKAKNYLSEKQLKNEIKVKRKMFDLLIKAKELVEGNEKPRITREILEEAEENLEGKNS